MARTKTATTEPAEQAGYSLQGTLDKLRKSRPDTTITILSKGAEESGLTIPWFLSTGILNLDWIMGRGVPGGRLIEIYSNNSSEGKSTIGATLIASAQRSGYAVMLLDSENGTLVDRLDKLGVDTTNLLFECPDTMEKGFDLCEAMIETVRESDSNIPILIVWDSVGAAQTAAERDAEYDARQVGIQARVLSSSLKKFIPVLRESKASLVCTNQVREKLAMGGYGGDTRDSVGGLGFKFYAHIRVALRRVGFIKDNNEITGIRVQALCKKNKVSVPFRKTEFAIYSDMGIDKVDAELTFAVQKGLVKETGKGFYSFTGQEARWRRANYEGLKPADFDEKLKEAFTTNFSLAVGDNTEEEEL